jgi:hypothetical protein
MPAYDPKRHWCDTAIWSLLGEKRTLRNHRKSVADDPQRHFATTDYRIAKGSLDHLVGAQQE